MTGDTIMLTLKNGWLNRVKPLGLIRTHSYAPLATKLPLRKMSNVYTITGGARVGGVNATWPFAKLSATPDQLTVAVGIVGTYSFTPDQVATIERYVKIPLLGWGVRIHHCNPHYPASVIFWCLGNPDAVICGIQDAGFLPAAVSSESVRRGGLAIRWSAIIIAIAVWNGLFLLGTGRTEGSYIHPGPFVLAPLAFAFAFSIGTLVSPKLQGIILKPGRSVGEIKPHLRLLALISGLLLVIFSILLATGTFADTPESAPPVRDSSRLEKVLPNFTNRKLSTRVAESKRGNRFPLSPGERAGVRASVRPSCCGFSV